MSTCKFGSPKQFFTLMSLLATVLLLQVSACTAVGRGEELGVPITGIDHLAEHLSIQDFWVNGVAGQQAGRGGRQVCCVSLSSPWKAGQTVKVAWAVTNWKRRVFAMYEGEVVLENCDAPMGRVWVHFLADGAVRAITCDIGPGLWEPNVEYPGPQPLATALSKKQPWTDYKRKAEEPEFVEVRDAMDGDGK